MKRIELLVLVGNLEKFKIVINFGVDVVYFGGDKLNLRVGVDNFIIEDLKEGVEFVYLRGKKIYVILNVILYNEDLFGIEEYFRELYDIGVDVVFIVDFGVISIVREVVLNFEIYLSI